MTKFWGKLESTFLGLWIFGWDRLPKRLHLACIWLAAFGTVLSSYFILAANSWMQHPVGSVITAARGWAELVERPARRRDAPADADRAGDGRGRQPGCRRHR